MSQEGAKGGVGLADINANLYIPTEVVLKSYLQNFTHLKEDTFSERNTWMY